MAKLLLLDDDPEIRAMVRDALSQEGYAVTAVDTIQAARDATAQTQFDLLVLDVMLPDGNGLKFARQVRAVCDVGVIMLTGLGDETDRVLGLEVVADDYIVKPFLLREFRARVNAVHRRVSRGTPLTDQATVMTPPVSEVRPLVFHGRRLDPASRTVTDDSGQPMDLTTLEFDVIRVLAENRNRVLSRDQIMDQVRGADWAAYDRNVDGLVCRLRRKLYPDGTGARRIKTVRNVGYMLAV